MFLNYPNVFLKCQQMSLQYSNLESFTAKFFSVYFESNHVVLIVSYAAKLPSLLALKLKREQEGCSLRMFDIRSIFAKTRAYPTVNCSFPSRARGSNVCFTFGKLNGITCQANFLAANKIPTKSFIRDPGLVTNSVII